MGRSKSDRRIPCFDAESRRRGLEPRSATASPRRRARERQGARGEAAEVKRETRMNGERKLALFIDFENIARGVKEAQYKQFEIKLVLERLLEKGKIIVRRAYAD